MLNLSTSCVNLCGNQITGDRVRTVVTWGQITGDRVRTVVTWDRVFCSYLSDKSGTEGFVVMSDNSMLS